jgi:hypothetical protein
MDMDIMIGMSDLPAMLLSLGITLDHGTPWRIQYNSEAAVQCPGYYGTIPTMVYFCTQGGQSSAGVYLVDPTGERLVWSLEWTGDPVQWIVTNCAMSEYLTAQRAPL